MFSICPNCNYRDNTRDPDLAEKVFLAALELTRYQKDSPEFERWLKTLDEYFLRKRK